MLKIAEYNTITGKKVELSELEKYHFIKVKKGMTEREILFRGKRVDNGEWVYGNLIYENVSDKYYIDLSINIREDDYCKLYVYALEVIPETIGQYTGLEDKNGKKIFEGDIVRNILILENNTFNENIDVVEFNKEDCSFMLGKGKRHFNKNLELEVIGNVFDEKE